MQFFIDLFKRTKRNLKLRCFQLNRNGWLVIEWHYLFHVQIFRNWQKQKPLDNILSILYRIVEIYPECRNTKHDTNRLMCSENRIQIVLSILCRIVEIYPGCRNTKHDTNRLMHSEKRIQIVIPCFFIEPYFTSLSLNIFIAHIRIN